MALKRAKVLSLVFILTILTIGTGMDRKERVNGLVNEASAAESQSAGFAWHPNRPGITRAQIALGRAATLKFEFSGVSASRVKFGIGKHFVDMGVVIDPKEVDVKGGTASSMAVFAVPPGMPLGKFDMVIVCVDAKTNKEVGRGKMPFMLLPAGVGGC